MLPSRSRLQAWNPDSLSPAGSAVGAGGQSVYRGVRELDDGIDRMPEARAWSGKSHKAATDMFRRATEQASQFSHYAEAVATALEKGSGSIGAARTALLNKADEVDQGELHVTDQWVVLIKPAQMSGEKAASLQQQAEQEQAEINRLLLAVGDADNDTAANVQAAAKSFGFQPPDRNSPFYGMKGGEVPPGDEVPNPRFPTGLVQQAMIRDQDMATTVRESREYTDEDGHHHKTLTMLDGSRHEITEWGTFDPTVDDIYYDKNGKLVSDTISQQQYDGVKSTSIRFGDGTTVTITETPDGKRTGGVITPDGRQGVLPDEFFSHPIPTLASGALSGLEKQTERGIPMLSAEALESVRAGAKYGGPAVGIATSLYDVVTAADFHAACVATFAGSAGVAGGIAADAALAVVAPEAVPLAAMGVNVAGAWTFGYVGGIIGNVVCPK